MLISNFLTEKKSYFFRKLHYITFLLNPLANPRKFRPTSRVQCESGRSLVELGGENVSLEDSQIIPKSGRSKIIWMQKRYKVIHA